jgi:hypothetical protein
VKGSSSVAVAAKNTFVPHAPGPVPTTISAGQVITGGLRSTTVLTARAILFVATGSMVVDDTVATFVICVSLATNTRESTVIVAVLLTLNVPRLTLNRLFCCMNVPCDAVADTKLTPAGSASVTTTDDAVFGPRFVIERV